MKRKRYTEEHIIRLLKEHEAGVTIEELALQRGLWLNPARLSARPRPSPCTTVPGQSSAARSDRHP